MLAISGLEAIYLLWEACKEILRNVSENVGNAIAHLVRGKGRVRKCDLGSAEARSDLESLFCRDGMAISKRQPFRLSADVRKPYI